MTYSSRILAAAVLALAVVVPSPPAPACSLVFLNENDVAKVVVRTMDLPLHFREAPRLVVFPRGMTKDSAHSVLPGAAVQVAGLDDHPMRWTAKYGSVGMVGFDTAVSDGVNEHGLAGHLLFLYSTTYEPKDDRPELGHGHWLTYVLDNFRSVAEAMAALQEGKLFRVVPTTLPDKGVNDVISMHLALEDPTGDSAVIELIDGKTVIYHGPQHRVLTNDPPYDEMLEHLKNYRPFGGWEGLPGEGPEGEPRFVRLSAYARLLPTPKTAWEAVAGALSLMRIAQVPFRDPDKELADRFFVFDIERLWAGGQTNWLTAIDLTHKVFYVSSALAPNLFWINLKDLDFNAGADVRYLDPHQIDLAGDVVRRLQPWKPPATPAPAAR